MDGVNAKIGDSAHVLGTIVASQHSMQESPKPLSPSDNKVKFSDDELKEMSDRLTKDLGDSNLNIKFAYDDTLKELYVMIYEKQTDKLLRQIPSEDAMNLSVKMKEVVGVLFDKNV